MSNLRGFLDLMLAKTPEEQAKILENSAHEWLPLEVGGGTKLRACSACKQVQMFVGEWDKGWWTEVQLAPIENVCGEKLFPTRMGGVEKP